MEKHYYIYIITNKTRAVLYIGVTNNLSRRLEEHHSGTINSGSSFTSKYKVWLLLHYEVFSNINDAIARETQLKKWSRAKKEDLIKKKNPAFKFLNALFQVNFVPPL